jgi:putative protease
MKSFPQIEIMAPVGSWESLRAAVQAGANAVYLGLEQLNMRSRSSLNFTVEDLSGIVSFCREAGVKVYLTLNVVVFEGDMEDMRRLVDAAFDSGVDAVIASDMAVILYARQKGMKVHISTQVNVSNPEAVRYYAAFADVMVLARELNLDQVRSIHEFILENQVKGPSGALVRLEMFVHGALCMAVSGKCYLSLHQYNHSANRGACLQVCRRSYLVSDTETGESLSVENPYIMSPKDLCTIGFVNKLLDAGVTVFKIEGRARGPEYVSTVVRTYREAICAVEDGTYGEEKIARWKEELSKVYNRGFWNGYYLGQRLGEWSHTYGSEATRKKVYVGKCTNYFSRLKVGEFLMETGDLSLNDEILITGPTTGLIQTTVSELRVDLQVVDSTKKGDLFSMPVGELVRRGDKLYKWITVQK